MDLDRIARMIASREKKALEIARRIREDLGDMFIEPGEYTAERISGIDGGIAGIRWHGLDIVLVRTVTATLTRREGRTEWTYDPSRAPRPDIEIVDWGASDHETTVYTSIIRAKREAEQVRKTLESARKGDVVFWDGSLLPHPSLRRVSTDFTRPAYKTLLEEYSLLYKTSEERNVLLAGVVEDSRSDAFSRHAIREMGLEEEPIPDTVLLSHALRTGEATRPLSALESYPEWGSASEETQQLAKRVYYYYQKPSKSDRPVRVEFIAPRERDVEPLWRRISGVLAAECKSRAYAIPPVLIEADLRARIGEEEKEMLGEMIRKRIARHTGMPLPSISEPLRRTRRPF